MARYLLAFWVCLQFLPTVTQAKLLPSKEFNDIVYFINDESTSLQRYSLDTELFLDEVTLTANPKAFHVDESGVYIAYSTEVFLLDHDLTSSISIRVTSEVINSIDSTDDYLLIAGIDFLQVLNKSDGTLVSTQSDIFSYIQNAQFSQDHSRILTNNSNNHLYFEISENGIIGDSYEKWHGIYIGEHIKELPNQNRSIDNSGNIFNIRDLSHVGQFFDSYQDLDLWQGLPIVLRDNTLYSYNKSYQETGSYPLSNTMWAQQIIVKDDAIYAFQLNTDDQPDDFTLDGDASLPLAAKVAVSATTPVDPSANVDPSTSDYQPSWFAINTSGETIYLFDNASLNLFQWSTNSQSYVEPIALQNEPQHLSYSAEHNRIYLAYGDGYVSYIDLTNGQEYSFTLLDSGPTAITTAGDLFVIRQTTNSWGALKTYNQLGEQLSAKGLIEPSNFITWNSIYNRVYYISGWSPADLVWVRIDPISGEIGDKNDSPYHNSTGWKSPIRVSENGRLVALASGRIVTGDTMEDVGQLATTVGAITDIAWLYGNLYTAHSIDNGLYTQFKRWKNDYTEDGDHSVEYLGKPIGLLPNPSLGKIHLLYQGTGSVQIKSFSFSAQDSDNDNVADYLDAFPENSAEQYDFDLDDIGDNADLDDDNDGHNDDEDAFPFNELEWADNDNDNIGDIADADDDNDGVIDYEDEFPFDASEQKDLDRDGIGDNADPDRDNDGVLNENDAFPLNEYEWFDLDGDGVGNNSDTDDGAFTPDSIALDQANGIIYMLDSADKFIHRWSIEQNDYLTPISLAVAPSKMIYAAQHQRIYFLYDSDVKYIALDSEQVQTLITFDSGVSAIASVEDFIVVRNSSGAWGSLIVLNKNGEIVDSTEWIKPTNDLVWSGAYNRLYYISHYSPRDLKWVAINPETGKLGIERSSPYHDSTGWLDPIKVSENGKYVSLNSGRVVTGNSLEIIKEVTNNLTQQATAWLYGHLFTLSKSTDSANSILQRWNSDLTIDSNNIIEKVGNPLQLLADKDTGTLYLITDDKGLPTVASYNFTAADDDNDGYLNHVDLFPSDSTEWVDYDDDNIGDNADLDDDNDNINDNIDALPFDNSEWLDTDSDGVGNNSDEDDDNDGVNDESDAFPLDNTETSDYDNDGQGNNADIDDDNDSVIDSDDAFPFDSSEWNDVDNDGIGSNTDDDDDGDGVKDSVDYYPLDKDRSEIVAVDFFPTNQGSAWRYRGFWSHENVTASLGQSINVANQNITPFTFSDGSSLYIKVVGNEVQLFGFNLPNFVRYSSTVYSTDFTLNKGINLLESSISSGSGKVDITPKYGNKKLSWNANVNYQGSESIYLSEGRFDALRTSINFTGTATVDGEKLSISYVATIGFVEGIGIVAIDNFNDSFYLTQHTITTNSEADSGDAPASNSSSGGSMPIYLFILFLTVWLARSRRKENL